jgi:hypothetical protein
MSGFLDVTTVVLPKGVADHTHQQLRRIGLRRAEGIALWIGRRDTSCFNITHSIIPAQRAVRSDSGLCAIVPPEELHRINMWLYQEKRSLFAQVHTHPTGAYHSDTDDAFPIATTVGCLSVVIPDFAIRPFLLRDCAIYRLENDSVWRELGFAEVDRFIKISGV